MSQNNPQKNQETSRIDDPVGLVKDILKYDSGRIRINTPEDTGAIHMSPGSSVYIGGYDDNLVLATNQYAVDDHYVTLTHNGYQTILTAGPEEPITVDYNTKDSPERIRPGASRQLYTEQQLVETTKDNALRDLDKGVTQLQLYNVTDNKTSRSLHCGRIGFSNESLYKALRITELGLDDDRVVPQHVTDDTQIRRYNSEAENPLKAVRTTYKPQPTRQNSGE